MIGKSSLSLKKAAEKEEREREREGLIGGKYHMSLKLYHLSEEEKMMRIHS